MRNTLKIAISLPREDFYRIEKIRKRLGFGRSTIIDKAIRFWLGHLEQQDLVKRYQEGYRNKPENIREITAMEKLSAEAFKEEDLE
jgi:metal-responsive CopG/Arc/MetJ family transcriptional regulator